MGAGAKAHDTAVLATCRLPIRRTPENALTNPLSRFQPYRPASRIAVTVQSYVRSNS
jgi:hypothetical protein